MALSCGSSVRHISSLIGRFRRSLPFTLQRSFSTQHSGMGGGGIRLTTIRRFRIRPFELCLGLPSRKSGAKRDKQIVAH